MRMKARQGDTAVRGGLERITHPFTMTRRELSGPAQARGLVDALLRYGLEKKIDR